MLRVIAFALLLGVSVAPVWAAPSFDCAKAVTSVEKIICADDHLAQLDVELAALYKTALEKRVVTPAAQREWIGHRDSECNSEFYVSRGSTLQAYCVEGQTRARVEDLRQRNLTGFIATDTFPQLAVINIPDQWWGFTPVYPEGVSNTYFDEVLLSDGKIIAELHWNKPGQSSLDFDRRWVDIITGEIVADSVSTPELADKMLRRLAGARIEPPYRDARIRFEDGSRMDFEIFHTNRCYLSLMSSASLFDSKSDNVRSIKILRKLDADRAFPSKNPEECRDLEPGPDRVPGRFEAMDVEILFGAPDGTLIAFLSGGYGAENARRLVRFRRDLSSPYFQTTSDLAVVQASDVAAVEKAAPESRFAGLDALFAKARAEAKP